MREVAEQHPDVELETVLVDAMAARMVQDPRSLDVLLAGNLFGDILSRPGRRARRRHGDGPERQHPAGQQHSRRLRAGARLGARHRRQGHRQPDGVPALGRDAAATTSATPRPPTPSTAHLPRPWSTPHNHTRDLGGQASTAQLAAAVLHEMETPMKLTRLAAAGATLCLLASACSAGSSS